MLKCEVRIALIESIKIVTRHKLLLINEIETLEVQAYDSLGNVFSSLQGLNFEWIIIKNKNLVKMLSLKQS